ncbi:MAG: adenosine kinase [Candidatus Rokuibacteriota bacterium]
MAERPGRADIDVLGIGNALVDVLTQATDDFLRGQGLVKGTMLLIDEPRARDLYAAMGAGLEVSGGSAANTIVGVASLGGRAHYVGKVRDDQLGEVFSHDLRSTGVGYATPLAASGPPTGRCLIMVTPDAQRTMGTFLGASVHLGPADVDKTLIERAGIVYLEGYLFDPPEAQEAFRAAAAIAHAAGRKVALTLSDPFCVDRHRAAFLDLVERHVDILFANEMEIRSLYQVSGVEAAVPHVRRHCEVAALTRSERGSVVVSGDQAHVVAAHAVDAVVDTTGAGDLYAAGFLVGLSRGCSLPTCGRLGALAASEAISHVGARPMAPLAELAGALLA